MIPIDKLERFFPLMEQSAQLYLSEKEFEEYELIPAVEKVNQLKGILEKPISDFTWVNEVYFRARWGEVLRMLHPQKDLKLLEIASGDADMIPQVMARTHPNSLYITANMNKLLNKSLLHKTKDLTLQVTLIDDDAKYIKNHVGLETVDIIAFQHSINDIVQAILCDKEGVDTIYSEWMEVLHKMIEILQHEISEGTLELHAKKPFLELMTTLLEMLKENGTIVMNHYMFQLDLDWGYPPDLFENMIPITREWMKELADCKEVFFDGFDSNWWIFLQKI